MAEVFKCPICDYSNSKLVSLSIHFRSKHDKTAEELCLLLFYNGVKPTCKCGCGEEVKYLGIEAKFREYKRGHIVKVLGKNSWGNNPKALEKSHKTRQKNFDSGKAIIWNKGLTAETSESVRINTERATKTINNNPELLQRASERMKKGRLNGSIRTVCGPESSAWKGGISSIINHCHSNTLFYKEWKYPKLLAANFKCKKCEETRTLQIHHDKEKMSDIIRAVLSENNIDLGLLTLKDQSKVSSKIKEKISNLVAEYHIKNNISGLVLCINCHKSEHPSLNF